MRALNVFKIYCYQTLNSTLRISQIWAVKVSRLKPSIIHKSLNERYDHRSYIAIKTIAILTRKTIRLALKDLNP